MQIDSHSGDRDHHPGSSLEQVLRSEGEALVIQDGLVYDRHQLLTRAERLQALLKKHPPSRVALVAHGVDAIVVALVACQSMGCELLLVREHHSPEDPLWETLGVSIILDEDLSIVRSLAADAQPVSEAGVLLMTSGTTRRPKVALHALTALLGRIRRTRGTASAERWLLTYHPASFAGLQVLLTTLVGEAQLIAVSEQSIAALADAALSYRPTHISATPTFWRSFLLAIGDRASEIPLRQLTLGGEACTQTLLDDLGSAFPSARITHIYASTEAGALFAVNDARAGFPASWLTAGIEGVELRIQDDVLEVKSPRAMRGYIGANAPTVRTEDDWIMTGDIVEAQGDRVYFRGRVDDLINVGGAKVKPEMVEEVLLRMPIISEARVFGIRNPITGALVGAEIVLANADVSQTSARQAIQSFASEHLEHHMIPRVLQFVPAITTTTAGKKKRQA